MLKPSYQTKYKKDLKRLRKQGKDLEKLKAVMKQLLNEQVLDESYRDHYLIGNYQGCRECHIEPDWLLIYIIDNENSRIIFVRSGSHSELFD